MFPVVLKCITTMFDILLTIIVLPSFLLSILKSFRSINWYLPYDFYEESENKVLSNMFVEKKVLRIILRVLRMPLRINSSVVIIESSLLTTLVLACNVKSNNFLVCTFLFFREVCVL